MRQTREERSGSTGMVKAFHREELVVDGVVGLIQQRAAGRHLGVCNTVYQPAFLSWNHRRTRSPCSSSTVAEICSAKRRNLCPSDTTRKLLRWRQRCNKVWNVERNSWRTVADRPISLSGSLLSAWRRQKPRRALGAASAYC